MKHHTKETTVLAERTAYAARMSLRYRLERENGFWISVTSGTDTARAYLGSDLETAWSLFCACERGRVTPCTLEDVCCDFFYAKDSVKEP